MDIKKQLLKDYPILNDADVKGDIVWTPPEPCYDGKDIMWKFNIKIKNNCILNWFTDDFLSKPIDQRGSSTDTDMSSPKKENWIRCWFSELGGKQMSSFVFSFSNQWEDAYLSNGGHRVNFSNRFLDPNSGLHNIDFDLPHTFKTLDGKVKTINLKGCKSLLDIKKKFGIRDWNNQLDISYHSVDLCYFEYSTSDSARKEHSRVFLYSNDNLSPIDKIHSIWSDINNFVRPVSDWLAYENDNILESFKDIWTKKKVYNEGKPYELVLKSLMFWKNGFGNTSKSDIQEFVNYTPMSKKEFTQFKTDFNDAMKLYIEQNKLQGSQGRFTYNFTRMFEYFCIYMFSVNKRKRVWKKNQYVVQGDYVIGMDTTIQQLLKESKNAGEGKGTYHYDRSTSSTEEGLVEVVRKVLGKLILNKVIVERDPRRNITKSQKDLLDIDCHILGVTIIQTDNEYHHIYKFYSQGGKSNTENVVRCSAEVNQYINKGGFKTTSDAIKSMLNDTDWISKFSDEKLEYWKNGGMEDLIKKENDDKYLYQSYDDVITLDKNDLSNNPHTFVEVKI